MRLKMRAAPVESTVSIGERQQMCFPLVIGVGVATYVVAAASVVGPAGAQFGCLFVLAATFFACAACVYGWFRRAPAPSTGRSIAGLVLDMTTLSLFLGVGDSFGAPLFPIYLWVIFGN